MAALYMLNELPSQQQLAGVMQMLQAGDALLLCGDAVELLRLDALDLPSQVVGYVLAEDIAARGLLQQAQNWQVIDYTKMVELSLQLDKVVSC